MNIRVYRNSIKGGLYLLDSIEVAVARFEAFLIFLKRHLGR